MARSRLLAQERLGAILERIRARALAVDEAKRLELARAREELERRFP